MPDIVEPSSTVPLLVENGAGILAERWIASLGSELNNTDRNLAKRRLKKWLLSGTSPFVDRHDILTRFGLTRSPDLMIGQYPVELVLPAEATREGQDLKAKLIEIATGDEESNGGVAPSTGPMPGGGRGRRRGRSGKKRKIPKSRRVRRRCRRTRRTRRTRRKR